MSALNRREFTRKLAAAGAAAATSSFLSPFAYAQGKGRVVIVGGGPGGATAAHHLKKAAPDLEVTLVEARPQYTTCFFSNLYLAGFRTFDSITHGYDGLKALGIEVVQDYADNIDTAGKTVRLRGGADLSYDKLVLSPGIDIKYDAIEGYSEAAAEIMPHAWQAGGQTQILKGQLEAMEDGGLVVMVAPPNPYRCPPGPYERISMIAHFLKTSKPKSKIMVFDPKETFSKQALFREGWEQHYQGVVEWIPPMMTGGGVTAVDAQAMTVTTADGETVNAAVINVIPPQRAGEIAHKAGCAEGDWCPVDPDSFASAKVDDIYVLGDASVAVQMPKSAFSANSQAKVVVNAIAAELAGGPRFPARYRNTCWSMISPDNSVVVGGNYAPKDNGLEEADGFISQTGEAEELRKKTFEDSLAWYDSIIADTFAT